MTVYNYHSTLIDKFLIINLRLQKDFNYAEIRKTDQRRIVINLQKGQSYRQIAKMVNKTPNAIFKWSKNH